MKMIKLLKKIFKINNAGMSLVEMVCAVGVMSIICMSIGGIMVSGARNYKSGVDEVTLQQKAQFVVNQLDDFLIDSIKSATFVSDSATDTDTLTMMDYDGTEYRIQRKGSDLVYWKIQGLSTESEVIATGVTSFKADERDFTRNGNIKLTLGFDDGSKKYAADFNITSRNAINTGAVADPSAAIDTENEIVLEPNQSYEFNPTILGDSCTLNYSIMGTTDAGTKITPVSGDPLKATLKISNAERTSTFNVKIEAISVADGTTVLNTKLVTVYVRRVTDVRFTYSIISGGGNQLGNGNSYKLEATVTGNNLDQKYGLSTDADYVDPRTIKWEFTATGMNTPPADTTHGTIITIPPTSGRSGDPKLTIKATSRHSNGEGNKSHTPYDSPVSYTVTISDPWYTLNGSDLYRASQYNLGELGEDYTPPYDSSKDSQYKFIREVVKAHPHELGNKSNVYNTGNIHREYRWRKASEPTGWSHAEDAVWKQADGYGNAIRIAEVFNDIPCSDSYYVEVRFVLIVGGVRYFPDSSTPREMYTIGALIDVAHPYVNISFSDGSSSLSRVLKGNLGAHNKNVTVTIKGDTTVSQLDSAFRYERYSDHYRIMQMDPATASYTIDVTNDNSVVQTEHFPDLFGNNKTIKFKKAGLYRIETWLKRSANPGEGITASDEGLGNTLNDDNFYYIQIN